MPPADGADVELRPATPADYDDVARISSETWEGDDYLQHVYHDWIAGDGKLTLVAELDGSVVGIAQMVLLSPWEAWGQGLRVDADHRGRGISERLTGGLFDWARDQGRTVARAMVFSWNQAGLGQSRAVGYEPVSEFRWLRPEPEDASMPAGITENPDAAWAYWTGSAPGNALAGLTLSLDESWAVQTLTRELLQRAAEETRLLAVTGDGGTRALSYRTRTFERENDDGETQRWAEYGVGAWADIEAGRTLLDAVAVDAAHIGADRTRVLIPERAQYVSDGAYLRANIGEEPDFLVAADLTAKESRSR